MTTTRKIVLYFLWLCGILLVLITIGSLISDASFWYLDVLKFPRLQVFLALLVCMALYAFGQRKWTAPAWIFMAGLLSAMAIQAYILFPYTGLAQQSIAAAIPGKTDKNSVFSLVLANVLMKNRQADDLLKIIADKDPTFVLTMEVNSWWVNQLSGLKERYPYQILFPTDNTYGMALYSKMPLANKKILFLNHGKVPSFHFDVSLPNGATMQMMAVHPVAPVPSEHPDNKHQKEVGLIKAGRIVANRLAMPTLVAGDFNDVGWSYNTSEFETISHLSDVRRGRGLFSTFDATSAFMRWPLDYVYTSSQFRVLAIERLPPFGSDHFPFYVQLALQP